MLGLYHLFFPLSQGRDESEKENNNKRITKKKKKKVKKIQGLSQYHLVLVKDNWVLLKEFTFFVDFLHLLYIVHRE